MKFIELRKDLDKKLFWLGIFLLPSAFSFSVIFFFISLLISVKNNYKKILTDKINLIFILYFLLLPLIALTHSEQVPPLFGEWDKSLTWIGLANWLPLFALFLGFQYYLDTKEDRIKAGNFFIAGTFPVLVSGIGQYFFNWHGPMEILNGLIIWYQRPIIDGARLSAVFNNQNYAGTWFCIVLPFCLSAFIKKSQFTLSKYISLFFLILVTTSLLLTTSRNAWGGLILLIPLMTGFSSIIWLMPIITILGGLISLILLGITTPELNDSIKGIIPSWIWMEFDPANFINRVSRLEIWNQSITYIMKRPFWGWGAASFPILYEAATKTYVTHPHNLLLELSISYGVPITALIFSSVLFITTLSFKKIYRNNIKGLIDNISEKAWFSSFFVLFTSQFFDIQYFDGRISVTFWILLAGLKRIISSRSSLQKNSNNIQA